MKTLDEVIRAYEICLNINETSCRGCPYTEFNAEGKWACSLCGDCTKDVLHYLKEYRDKMANDEKAYKRGYSCGYAKAKKDEEENRRWDESYRASQMPWNHGCEMGG